MALVLGCGTRTGGGDQEEETRQVAPPRSAVPALMVKDSRDALIAVAEAEAGDAPPVVTGSPCLYLGDARPSEAELALLSGKRPGLEWREYVAECLVPTTYYLYVSLHEIQPEGVRLINARWKVKCDVTCFSYLVRARQYTAVSSGAGWDLTSRPLPEIQDAFNCPPVADP